MESRTNTDDTALRQALARVLRDLREERQLTQDALADASGCHVNHISFLERRLRVPSLLVVFQIARGLGLSPAHLVRLVEEQLSAAMAEVEGGDLTPSNPD